MIAQHMLFAVSLVVNKAMIVNTFPRCISSHSWEADVSPAVWIAPANRNIACKRIYCNARRPQHIATQLHKQHFKLYAQTWPLDWINASLPISTPQKQAFLQGRCVGVYPCQPLVLLYRKDWRKGTEIQLRFGGAKVKCYCYWQC